jgi:cytochrome P450
MRTAQVDTEVAGMRIGAGDWVYLSYPGANIDPAVFADPLHFDITRPDADRHLAFGHGVHFCLGAQLARMELRSLLGRLVPALASVEIAGEVAYTQTTAVGGVKRLPIAYQLR